MSRRKWSRKDVFALAVKLYTGEDVGDFTSISEEYRDGEYSVQFMTDEAVTTLSQTDGSSEIDCSIFAFHFVNEVNQGTIARCKLFPDGGFILTMERHGTSIRRAFHHIEFESSGVLRCMHCSNSSFKSAVLESSKGVLACSARPEDWICGHEEMDKESLESLVDVLMCTNPHCTRYNYVMLNMTRITGPEQKSLCFDLVGADVSSNDIYARRMDLASCVASFASSLPGVLCEQIVDFILPRRGEFVSRTTPTSPESKSAIQHQPRMTACDLFENGEIVLCRDNNKGRIVKYGYGFKENVVYTFNNDTCNDEDEDNYTITGNQDW